MTGIKGMAAMTPDTACRTVRRQGFGVAGVVAVGDETVALSAADAAGTDGITGSD
jgi:hypothetical protein